MAEKEAPPPPKAEAPKKEEKKEEDEKKKDEAKKSDEKKKEEPKKDEGNKPEESKKPDVKKKDGDKNAEPSVEEAKSVVASVVNSTPIVQGGAILAQIAMFPPGLADTDSEEDSIDGDGENNDDDIDGKGGRGKGGVKGRNGKDGNGSKDESMDGSAADGSLSARNRRLNRRGSSNPPPGPIGTMFMSNGKWMVKCTVHARISMEVEELLDPNAELRKYVRPGGDIRLVRYACVDEGVPVCAQYPDWRYHPELRFVKAADIAGYRRRRIQRWLSEVCPIQENERFDRFLVRCHALATQELKTFNEEFEAYQDMFPHILDNWVALLHLGILFRRKNMGKTRFYDEVGLLLELMREECEILFLKKKLLFYDQPEEEREYSRSHNAWQMLAQELCGSVSPI